MSMRVSAIVPAYNAGRFLVRAIDSLIQTAYPNLEIIIIDDGSTDESFSIACELQETYPATVQVLQHQDKANHGVSASRNLGLRECTGELICFLDADDYVYPHRFNATIPFLEKDTSVDGVYGTTLMVFGKKADQAHWVNREHLFGITESVPQCELLPTLLTSRVWATSAILFRRRLLEKTGLFDERFPIAEDCHLYLRMASTGKIVAGDLSKPMSAYVRHNSNSYYADIGNKVHFIRAVADVDYWARKKRLENSTIRLIRDGLGKYVLGAVISARETHKQKLAWKMITAAFSHHAFGLLQNSNLVKQIVWLFWESVTKRKPAISTQGVNSDSCNK